MLEQAAGILIVVVAGYGFWKFLSYYLETKLNYQLFFWITFLLVAIYYIFQIIQFEISQSSLQLIQEWIRVSIAATSLTALAYIIRNSKPHFARFPFVFGLFPLLLIPSYYFAIETVFLKELVVSVFFGGSLFIALLIFSLKTYKKADFALILGGIFILLLLFVINWIPERDLPISLWAKDVILAIALIMIIKPYQTLYTHQEYDFEYGS